MPLPLTVSCFSKIQIGFSFLVPAYPGSPGQRAVKRVCVCVCVCVPPSLEENIVYKWHDILVVGFLSGQPDNNVMAKREMLSRSFWLWIMCRPYAQMM